jgi:hypothetical protein
VPTFVDRRVSRGQCGGSPTVVNLSFLDRIDSTWTRENTKVDRGKLTRTKIDRDPIICYLIYCLLVYLTMLLVVQARPLKNLGRLDNNVLQKIWKEKFVV